LKASFKTHYNSIQTAIAFYILIAFAAKSIPPGKSDNLSHGGPRETPNWRKMSLQALNEEYQLELMQKSQQRSTRQGPIRALPKFSFGGLFKKATFPDQCSLEQALCGFD